MFGSFGSGTASGLQQPAMGTQAQQPPQQNLASSFGAPAQLAAPSQFNFPSATTTIPTAAGTYTPQTNLFGARPASGFTQPAGHSFGGGFASASTFLPTIAQPVTGIP